MNWWMYASIGAMLWGVHYVLLERAMTVAQPITVYIIPNVLLIITLPFWYKIVIEDYKNIMAAGMDVKASVVAIMFTSIIASLLVYKSISLSNATLASLIEIAYPVFVAIFAYVIFGENHLTHWTNILGGLLIFSGAGLVVYKG